MKKLQIEGKLVKSEITSRSLPGYGMVIKHERISPLSYCVEWPAIMLKEAALLTLELSAELASHDLVLQDAYPWNVYFMASKPIFIDLGSIVRPPSTAIWVPFQQFRSFFLYPLYIASAKLSQISRTLLFDYLNGIDDKQFLQLLPFLYKVRHPHIFTSISLPYYLDQMISSFVPYRQSAFEEAVRKASNRMDMNLTRKKFFRSLSQEVRSIEIKIENSHWSKYYQNELFYSLSNPFSWDQKQKSIANLLDQCKPKSVLDIGCNRGFYTMLAAQKGCKVVAFDKDEACISQLFLDARSKDLNILPLIMDILNPTPAFGWRAKQFPAAHERFSSEMVLALALVHHLVFRQWQNFDRIVATLKDFTQKWLVVGFPLPEDERVKGMWKDRCGWYSLDNFLKAMNKDFEIIGIYDSYPATRKLILGKRR